MLFLADWLTLLVFWLFVLRLFRSGGTKTAAAFVILWFSGYFGFPLLGIEGALYFLSYKALLCLALQFMDLYLTNMSKRRPQENPLTKIQE